MVLYHSFVISVIIIFSYAISRQFKDLVEKAQEKVNTSNCEYDSYSQTSLVEHQPEEVEILCKIGWGKLVKKHRALTDLVGEFDLLLSPLIFVTYGASLYLICMQVINIFVFTIYLLTECICTQQIIIFLIFCFFFS